VLNSTPDAEGLVPALSVRELQKSFGATVALSAVDLEVLPGQINALVGENGSGKSTLIKIISGYHRPDSGTAFINGQSLHFGSPDASHNIGARFVHQNLGLVANISVVDNLALQRGYATTWGTISRRRSHAAAREALEAVSLDVKPTALIADLSPAERTGVAIARAFSRDLESPPRLLVLDEPTATLPEREVSKLLDITRAAAARGVGVLYVTHRLDEIFELAQHVTVLRSGRVHARTAIQDLTRPKLVKQLVGEELNEISRESSTVVAQADRVVLDVASLESPVLHEVSLQVRVGEIVGIAGITGSGRESLCGAVFGAVERSGGRVSLLGKDVPAGRPASSIEAGMAMIPADRERLGGCFSLTARENITITSPGSHWGHGLLTKRSESKEIAHWFSDLDVRPANAYENLLGAFSGGNQQKLIFAKWLRIKPKMLLVDEPTQGVDIGAKGALHRQLLEAARNGAGVLLSSTDTDELVATCHRVIVLQRGRVVATLSGQQVTQADVAHACVAENIQE
jgi:ribose transport system ATP-binding protein